MRDVSREGVSIITSFVKSLHDRELNTRTIEEYQADLKHFIGWHEYQGMDSVENVLIFSFKDICVKELNTYVQAMKDVNLKGSTINRRLSTLKLFFDWAYESRLSNRNPSKHVKLVPLERSAPKVINKDEKKRLLEAVLSHGSLRDQVILKLMIHTGLRVGETCNIKVCDVDLINGRVKISSPKEPRVIKLTTGCKSSLTAYIKNLSHNTVYLFSSEKTGGKLTDRALRHLLKKYIDIAGLEGISPYSFKYNLLSNKSSYVYSKSQ